MAHDNISRITTDDTLLDHLAAGYKPTSSDERLVQYAAAYRDQNRENEPKSDAFDFFVMRGANRRYRLFNGVLCASFVFAAVLFAIATALVLINGAAAVSLAFTLMAVAGGLALLTTIMAVFVPTR
jgi:hypothetical protein